MSAPRISLLLAGLLSLALGALPACSTGLEQPQDEGRDDGRPEPGGDDAADVELPDPTGPADVSDDGGDASDGGGDGHDGSGGNGGSASGDGADDGSADVTDPPAPGSTAVCGNGVVEEGETCDEEHEGCVDCRIPCGFEGGRACGQNGVPGDEQTLYVCQDGERVPLQVCEHGCLGMPAGTPDRCAAAPGDEVVPQRLIDALSVRPYVEQDCEPVTVARWPFQARRCRYTAGPLTATVTTATPSAARVGAWIVDAVSLIPAVQALRETSPSRYEDALIVIANAVLGQSSRIFPLQGGIIENMGTGYQSYPFRDGITEGCSSGCYCRINSLHRTEWCAYQAGIGAQRQSDCLDEVGRSGHTDGWAAQCLGNHVAAWNSTRNEHFRAKAFRYQQSMASRCPREGSCSPREVVEALRSAVQ